MATQASSLSDFGHFKLLQSFDIKYAPVKEKGDNAGRLVIEGMRLDGRRVEPMG
jgi:hypothetical protein